MFAITVWYIDKTVFQLCLRNRTKIEVYAGIIIYLYSPTISSPKIPQINKKNDVKTKCKYEMNFIFLRFMEVWTQRVPCKVKVVTYFARDPLRSYFHEPQKNEIYFLNKSDRIGIGHQWLPRGVTKGSIWYGGAAWHLQNPPHSYTWALKIRTYSYTIHSKLPPIHILVWHIEWLLGKTNKPIYTNSI